MYHLFDANLAAIYGVNEAILLYNIAFWVNKNEANKHNGFEGKYWTFNTSKAFSALFPYMSERTIQRTIKHLIDEELIESGNFNNDPRNRTNYYTLTDFGKEVTANWQVALCQIGGMHNATLEASILKDNSDSSTDINNTVKSKCFSPDVVSRKAAEREAMFEQFWEAYPRCFRKTDKKGCKAKFLRIENLEKIFPDILASLELQKRSEQWREKNGKFIPMPSTWINQERWTIEDERLERQAIIRDIAKKNMPDFLL